MLKFEYLKSGAKRVVLTRKYTGASMRCVLGCYGRVCFRKGATPAVLYMKTTSGAHDEGDDSDDDGNKK